MTMPKNYVLLRHGKSVRNHAGHLAFHQNDLSLFDDVINKPSSVSPLSEDGDNGVWQAKVTGDWLMGQGFNFRRKYTSSFNRAKQTAGLLKLSGQWYIDNNIRERSGGVMEDMTPLQRKEYLAGMRNRGHLIDPFNFRPDRGESYADVDMRMYMFFNTLHRECSEDDVLVVNHGDNMWVQDYRIRRWTTDDFIRIREADRDRFPNCIVVHYTRINPFNPEAALSKHLDWVRTCCPWQDTMPGPWERIVRKSYSSEDLLEQVAASVERSTLLAAS